VPHPCETSTITLGGLKPADYIWLKPADYNWLKPADYNWLKPADYDWLKLRFRQLTDGLVNELRQLRVC
jgi:hypothetical protein